MSDAKSVNCPEMSTRTFLLLFWIRGWQLKFWLFLVLGFCVAVPSYASQQPGAVTVIGYRDCKTWLADRRKAQAGQGIENLADAGDVAWVLGFITGLNYASAEGADMLRAIDADTIAEWVDRYCQQHPREGTVDAAAKLFVRLQRITK